MDSTDVLNKMTDEEYAAWVEKGEFPKRLAGDLKQLREESRKRREQKREERAAEPSTGTSAA